MNFFDLLEKATIARLINWKPTGEEKQDDIWEILHEYEAEIDGFKVTTIVRPRKRTLDNQSEHAAGIIIEKDNKNKTFSSDIKAIPGIKNDKVWGTCYVIQREAEKEDLASSLSQSLVHILSS